MESNIAGSKTQSRPQSPEFATATAPETARQTQVPVLVPDATIIRDAAGCVTSEDQLRAILLHSHAAKFIKDHAGRYLLVNDRFVEEFGVARAALLGRTDAQVFPPDLAQSLQVHDARVLAQGNPLQSEQQRLHQGERRTNLLYTFPVRNDAGLIIGIGGSVTDITAQLRAATSIHDQSMRQSLIAAFGQFALQNPDIEELITEAVEISSKGLQPEFSRYLSLSATGPCSETALHLKAGSGWSGIWGTQVLYDAVIETEDRFSIGARETALILDYATETRNRPSPVIKAHGIRSGAEVLVWGVNGPYGLLGVYSRRPHAFDRQSVDFLQGIKNTLAAAIDRKSAEDRLAYLAQFDALTGLPNHNLYVERLSQTLRQTEWQGRRVGVLFVDVDRFKSVNDKLGHSGGDAVLMQVARRLQSCARPNDTVARLSGDEFALLLDHLDGLEEAAAVAECVIASLAKPFRVDTREVYVSASLGISVSPADGSTSDSLLKHADLAMYRAKQSGRNTYRFFAAEMNERAAEHHRMEGDLRGAVDRHEFVLHYQPKADLKSGAISGFEALLRWNHPLRGLVPPAEFIPILEDTGLIDEVGDWVIRQACEQIRLWQLAGLPHYPVAVNLSARQFTQSGLETTIGSILDESQIDAGLLEIELTESVLMSDSEDALRVLDNIKQRGIRLSVDDFGTGYSSLAYLKRFPLDSLKIDRAFIRDITTDSGGATIAKAIINLAHSLKLKVVAEGVEKQAQLDFLRDHGCDEIQGFLFARPMPAAECERAMREGLRLMNQVRAVVS